MSFGSLRDPPERRIRRVERTFSAHGSAFVLWIADRDARGHARTNIPEHAAKLGSPVC